MIVTNLKLHHDWREDWEGVHMRRVGNNWNNIAHALQEKGVWRGVRMHGAAWHSESCRFINIPPKGRCKRGFMAENETDFTLETIPEVQCCQFNTFIALSICRQKDSQEGCPEQSTGRYCQYTDSLIFCLKDTEKRCSKALQPEITEN